MTNPQVVKYPAPKLNAFPVGWKRQYTLSMGGLYPVMCEYAMPNSRWKFKALHKLRTLAMIAPTMHNIRCYVQYFKVPLRLLMNEEQYANYMTGGKNDDDNTPTPSVNSGINGYAVGSLMDYLGYASNYLNDNQVEVKVPNVTQNAWALRAYNKIINDWYINPNITDERVLSLESGLDTTTDQTLFYRGWQPDKYTNAMPSLQRGDPTYLPLGQSADVSVFGNGNVIGLTDGTGLMSIRGNNSVGCVNMMQTEYITTPNYAYGSDIGLRTAGISEKSVGLTKDAKQSGIIGQADLTGASAIDVNELRDTMALGFAKNLGMYVGYRLTDWLYGMFGCRPADARLQRAEFIGGTVSPVIVDEVEQTSATVAGQTPQGNLAGKGITINGNKWIKCFCDEPCVIMGLMSIMPDPIYMQGSRKWMNYDSRYDYPNPIYARISDQAIEEREIMAMADNSSVTVQIPNPSGTGTIPFEITPKTTFGFEPRFQECRTIPSTIHGQMRSTLKFWTLAREFDPANPPMLNDSFIYAGSVSKRIFANTDNKEDNFVAESIYRAQIVQPLPKNQLPSSMGLLYGDLL
ncbi:MAG: major capsid protein [Microviridae sp.]|nr:MAG: major capsid protein [Microviridae sp.]